MFRLGNLIIPTIYVLFHGLKMSENLSTTKEESPMPATATPPKKGKSRKSVPASDKKATAARAQARAKASTTTKSKAKTKTKKTTAAPKKEISNSGPKVGMEVVKKVCASMKDNPEATSRAAIRKASGIEKLGLPWLVENGYVKQEVQEGQRAHAFSLTAKGKKFK